MDVATFQNQVKADINASPTSYTAADYLQATNEAIVRVANVLEKKDHPDLLDSITVTNGAAIPEYFIRFAGNYPVSFSGGNFVHSEASPITAKYYRMPAAVTLTSDTFPYRQRTHIEAAKLAAACYLKERRGFNMAQEWARFDRLLG
jgi:hypothetical protein